MTSLNLGRCNRALTSSPTLTHLLAIVREREHARTRAATVRSLTQPDRDNLRSVVRAGRAILNVNEFMGTVATPSQLD